MFYLDEMKAPEKEERDTGISFFGVFYVNPTAKLPIISPSPLVPACAYLHADRGEGRVRGKIVFKSFAIGIKQQVSTFVKEKGRWGKN